MTATQILDTSKLQYEIDNLREENTSLVSAITEHQRARSLLEKKLSAANELRREYQEFRITLNRIQKIVIALYMEFLGPNSNIVQEREKLEKERVIVVLELLRQQARRALITRKDITWMLKTEVDKLKDAFELDRHTLESNINNLRTEMEVMRDGFSEKECAMKEASETRERLLEESNRLVDFLKKDNIRLRNAVEEKQSDIDNLRMEVDRLNRAIEGRDDKLKQVTRMETEMKNKEAKHEELLHKLQLQHVSAVQYLQKEMSRLSKSHVEKQELEMKLQQASMQLDGYKKVESKKLLDQKEREITKLKKRTHDAENEARKGAYELKRTKIALAEAERRVSSLRNERLKFTDKISKLTEEQQAVKHNTLVELESKKGMLSASYYKEQLGEQLAINNDLVSKMRMMVINEQLSKVTEKSFQDERAKMGATISDLRNKIGKLRPASALGRLEAGTVDDDDAETELMWLRRRNDKLERKLAEMENVVHVAEHLRDKHERLLQLIEGSTGLQIRAAGEGVSRSVLSSLEGSPTASAFARSIAAPTPAWMEDGENSTIASPRQLSFSRSGSVMSASQQRFVAGAPPSVVVDSPKER